MPIEWTGIQGVEPKRYVCGHCDTSISSERGYRGNFVGTQFKAHIYICHTCTYPTFIWEPHDDQVPGASFGDNVEGITDEVVKSLYDEARNCFKANSFTASVLCCRKLLMNIAVSKGAKEGENFFEYVEFLSNENFIPPGAKDWVDHIRTKGNEATHEIKIMESSDAEDLLKFIGMLLKIVYEFPDTIKKRIKKE